MFIPNPRRRAGARRGHRRSAVGVPKRTSERTDPRAVEPTDRARNIAIYGDKIFVAHHRRASRRAQRADRRVVWDQPVADYKLGYRYTSGPIIAKGKVVAGMTGCDALQERRLLHLRARSANTGKEVWRTSTVARPGEPGGDTWGDLPLPLPRRRRRLDSRQLRSRAEPRFSGPPRRPSRGPARSAAPTATRSTRTARWRSIADTGKIVWYHQFIPGETHDLDEVFESILIDRRRSTLAVQDGQARHPLGARSEDRQVLQRHDLGYQNVVTIDPKTGQGIVRPERVPKLGVPIDYCPGPGGLKNLFAMGYHPGTRAFYVPLKSAARTPFLRRIRVQPTWRAVEAG